MKFKYLEHTSEAKFQAYGKTLEDAFENVVLALFNILTDTNTIKPLIKKPIEIKSKKLESLLFDFVDKLIFLQDTEGFLPCTVKKLNIKKINIKKNKEYLLDAEILGDNFSGYETHGHLKAPTYNDMFIRKEKNRYVIQMVVDI